MPEINIPNFDKADLTPPQIDVGTYDVNITQRPELKSNDKGNQYLEVQMTVLSGPDQTQANPSNGSLNAAGRTIRDWVFLTESAAWRLKTLMVASGLLAREDTTSPMGKGSFNSDMLLGTKFQVAVTKRMYEGKEYNQVQYVV